MSSQHSEFDVIREGILPPVREGQFVDSEMLAEPKRQALFALRRIEEQLQAAQTRIETQTAIIEDQGANIAEVVQERLRMKEQLQAAEKQRNDYIECQQQAIKYGTELKEQLQAAEEIRRMLDADWMRERDRADALQEQLEAAEMDSARRTDLLNESLDQRDELKEQYQTAHEALVKIAEGPSDVSPPEIARCALGWPSHGWTSGVWGE